MKKILLVVMVIAVTFGIVSCKKDGGGDLRPGQETTITFWGYGDTVEKKVFETLVTEFNELNKNNPEGSVKVKYVQKSADGYADALKLGLMGTRGPDVVYVEDATYKSLAELGYLLELDDYIDKSTEVNPEEMWDSSINRYLYDVNTTTSNGPDAHYWGIPKDIGPTVIYYNETFFKNSGVTVISVDSKDLKEFNEGAKDSRGKTKVEYGITGEVKNKGYFELNGKKYFNNKVAMNWEETVALSKVVQTTSEADYGFFTEWWFNYGWTVGGDVIQYIPTTDTNYNGGYWDFTLMDDTPNYMVKRDYEGEVVINGTSYKAGSFISYYDKLANLDTKTIKNEVTDLVNSNVLDVFPSQREAFVEFVRIGQKSSVIVDGSGPQALYGYGITPTPTSIGGDAGKTKSFANGNVAMLVDGRWNVPNFREQMDGKYEWDVAPLPVYRTYDEEGNVLLEGASTGHSGSVALAINAKSSKPAASWKFLEYIGGKVGQLAQAKSGFAIPSQRYLAESEDFLQSNQNPKNSVIFLSAAENQTPGDWWYLRDKEWIDPWAGILNGSVRNGLMTLTEFQNSKEYNQTYEILKKYTRKD